MTSRLFLTARVFVTRRLLKDGSRYFGPYTDVGHMRRALRTIKINVGLALAVKALVLALTLTGHATLWMAVAADVGASLVVVLHGMTLLRYDMS